MQEKTPFVIALLCAALLVPASAARAQTAPGLKIGYIVTPRLMTETNAGKQAAEDLKQRLAGARGALEKKLKEVQALEEDLQKRMMMLSEEERKKAAEQHEKEVREARRLREDMQRELQKAEGEVMERVNAHLRGVIEKYGDAHGYDIILDASALVYVSEKADITDDIIKAADAAR